MPQINTKNLGLLGSSLILTSNEWEGRTENSNQLEATGARNMRVGVEEKKKSGEKREWERASVLQTAVLFSILPAPSSEAIFGPAVCLLAAHLPTTLYSHVSLRPYIGGPVE